MHTVSSMENDVSGADQRAREQLAELDAAVGSTRAAAFPPSPRWYWFAFAAVAPAAVAVESQSGLLRYAAILGAAAMFAAVGAHDWHRRKVRPLRARRSTAQMRAAFLFVLVFALTLFLLRPAVSIWPSWIVAVVSYAWLVVALWGLGRRLERAMVPGGESAVPGAG